MVEKLRILLIDENTVRAAVIEEGLREAGYDDVVVISETTGLMRRIAQLEPDVVLIDLESPSRDVLEAMFEVSRCVERPIGMFVDRSEPDMIRRAMDAGVSTYIVDGLRKERVKAIVEVTISRFQAVNRLRQELEATKRALADRTAVDRAKAILMRKRRLSEPEAYALLRRKAMDEQRTIADVASALITAAALLGEGAP